MRPLTDLAPRATLRFAAFGIAAALILGMSSTSVLALSEIKREDIPAPVTPGSPQTSPTENAVPMPDPIQAPPAAAPGAAPTDQQTPADGVEPDDAAPADGAANPAMPSVDTDGPLPEIIYDLSRLPEPVSRMRTLLIEAAKTGDIEKLRPLIGSGDSMPQLSFGDIPGDPIEFIRSLSGDGEGQEILAIMEEVLNAGYVHLGEGSDEDLYVWPYFFGIPLDKLDARQKVELFKIVTAGDYEDMKQYGTYVFYRLGITPEGHWAFFVAGD